jgi:O-antigen ligase
MRNFIQQYMNEVRLGHLIVFIAVGTLVSLLLLTIPPNFIYLMLSGIFVLAIILRRPELGILIIVVLTSSIVFEESLPLVPIGVGSLHISDVLLLFMLGTLGYRYFTDKSFTFVKSPVNTPLLLFVAASLLSATISVTHYGADFNDIARLFRFISYYLLFFLITNLITEKGQVRFLIKALFAIAAVVAATMVLQAIIGDSIQLMPGRIESAATFSNEFETLRILPPGQTLVFVTFITSICALVFVQDKPVLFSGSFCLVLLLGMGIILTFNRSYWVAGILAVMILLMMTATENKIRLVALLTVVLISAGSILAMFGGTEGKLGATVDAVSERFSSLFAGSELEKSGPVRDRRIENEYAVEQIKRHPLLGIGLGNDYRPQIYGPDDKLNYYVHNAYLWLLTDLGIVGFLFYFWFYLRFLISTARNWKRISDNFLKSVVAGFMISAIVILLMALVIPLFMEWFSIVVIAVMMGLTETIIRNCEMEAENLDADQ